MHRRFDPSAAAVLVALVFGTFATPQLRAQEVIDEPASTSAPSAASVRISGDAAALEIQAHRSTVADVLAALAGFNIRYRARGTLDETIDGVYTGSLGRVLSRILAGYDYAIRTDNEKIDVIVVGRSGDHAVPAPVIIPVRRRPSD